MTGALASLNESLLRSLPAAKLRNVLHALRLMPTAGVAIQEEFGREDPRDFIRDVLGAKPSEAALSYGYKNPWTPDQERILVSVMEHRKTLVQSGHGTGKTRDFAWLVPWWLFRRKPSKVVTTASSWTQLATVLWGEIGAVWGHSVTPLPGKKNLLEIKLEPDWYAIGLSTTARKGDLTATRFQGHHSPNLLVIIEEAAGVEEEMFEGAEGMAIGPDDRIVAGGNPTNPNSRMHKASQLPSWNVVHLDSRNHPNVIHRDHRIVPGAVSYEWVKDRLEEYGSEESPLFMSKVAGLWPEQAEEALINLGWVTKAQVRWDLIQEAMDEGTFKDLRKGAALGVDVAREGTDLTNAWMLEHDRVFLPKKSDGKYAWHVGRDTSHAVDMVLDLIREYPQIRVVVIDDTGIGGAVTDELRRQQREGKIPRFDPNPTHGHVGRGRSLWLVPVNFGGTAWEPKKYDKVKDELWWGTREALRKGGLAVPTDAEFAKYSLPKTTSLLRQLTTPIYGQDSAGQIVVWDKKSAGRGSPDEAMRKRIDGLPTKSPDLGHAIMLAVHGWKKLKPGTVVEAPKDLDELFAQQTRDLIERATRQRDPRKPNLPGKKAGPLSPYQRRRR